MTLQDSESTQRSGETSLFRKEGEYWTISYQGQLIRVRDSKGLEYIAYLLRHPGHAQAATAILAATNNRQEHAGAVNGREGMEAERSRLAVTKRIKAALQKLWLLHPALGHHLRVCIATGSQCVYNPDPVRPVLWEFVGGCAATDHQTVLLRGTNTRGRSEHDTDRKRDA